MAPPAAAAVRPPWRKSAPPPWVGQWREWRDMGPGDSEGWKEVGKAPACAKCGCKNNVRGSVFCRACGHKLSDFAPTAPPEPGGVWADAAMHGDGGK
eukprot:7949794-Pyramimonas_sp.AAC.1